MGYRMRRRVAILALAAAVVLQAGVGCQRAPDLPRTQPEPTAAPEPSAEPTPGVDVRLYFVRGEHVGVAGRRIDAGGDTATVALSSVAALLSGPGDADRGFGLDSAIPSGTTVNGVKIANRVATVDLSKRFGSGGGSLSMRLRVAQAVFTLTQFEGIDAVAFELDGKPTQTLGGEGVMVGPSVTRADFEEMAPPILVESPVPGAVIASPVTVSGSANTFEAVHQLEIIDPQGRVIARKTSHASSGTGTRGVWRDDVSFETTLSGPGYVTAFEVSPKDGAAINVVKIPVRFE